MPSRMDQVKVQGVLGGMSARRGKYCVKLIMFSLTQDDNGGSQVFLLVYSSLQKILVMQRVEPLTGICMNAPPHDHKYTSIRAYI